MKGPLLLFALSLFVAACGAPSVPPQDSPPPARPSSLVVQHYGVEVADPFRWLETMDADTRGWVEAQDRHARDQLSSMPELARLEASIERAATARRSLVPVSAGQRRFFVVGDAAMTRSSVEVEEGGHRRLLVDGGALAEEGRTLHRRLWPSPGGEELVYGVSDIGSLDLKLWLMDVDSGQQRQLSATGLVAGRSTVSWAADGGHLAYTAADRGEDGRHEGMRLLALDLATAEEETLFTVGEAGARLWHWSRQGVTDQLLVTEIDAEGRSRMLVVENAWGVGLVRPLFERGPGGFWYAGDLDGAAVVATTVGAPKGEIRTLGWAADGTAEWRVLVPETDRALDTWVGIGGMAVVTGDRVAAVYRGQLGWEIRAFDAGGDELGRIPVPAGRSMWSGLVATEEDGIVAVSLTDFTDPGRPYSVNLESGEMRAAGPGACGGAASPYLTEVVHYPRPGEDPAPMFLARRGDLEPDGRRPVLVYGYGWGAWSASPWFRPHVAAFLDEGGIMALPVLRGGGERGDAWHRAGVRRNRQNAIDDYLAACRWLAGSRWSAAGRIVAEGQSAGGSLAAMAVLQQPGLFGAQILAFPVLDMLRYERFTGATSWRGEFGTVEDPEDFRVLLATSPVHRIPAGFCPPPTLVLPGEVDEVTPPLHGFKYVAALNDAKACDAPVWMRVAWGTGHAYGNDGPSTAASLAAQVAFIGEVLD